MGMKKTQFSIKEYEALATIRDILAILYAEISENLGRDSDCLSAAYDYIAGLTEIVENDLEDQ